MYSPITENTKVFERTNDSSKNLIDIMDIPTEKVYLCELPIIIEVANNSDSKQDVELFAWLKNRFKPNFGQPDGVKITSQPDVTYQQIAASIVAMEYEIGRTEIEGMDNPVITITAKNTISQVVTVPCFFDKSESIIYSNKDYKLRKLDSITIHGIPSKTSIKIKLYTKYQEKPSRWFKAPTPTQYRQSMESPITQFAIPVPPICISINNESAEKVSNVTVLGSYRNACSVNYGNKSCINIKCSNDFNYDELLGYSETCFRTSRIEFIAIDKDNNANKQQLDELKIKLYYQDIEGREKCKELGLVREDDKFDKLVAKGINIDGFTKIEMNEIMPNTKIIINLFEC